MFSKHVLSLAVFLAVFSLGQAFFYYSNRCSNYNPATVTACNVANLCALTGAARDTAIACLRGQAGSLGIRKKIQTCDATGNNACVDATHCVDLAAQRCVACARTPQLLTVFGCKAYCGYRLGERLRQCTFAG